MRHGDAARCAESQPRSGIGPAANNGRSALTIPCCAGRYVDIGIATASTVVYARNSRRSVYAETGDTFQEKTRNDGTHCPMRPRCYVHTCNSCGSKLHRSIPHLADSTDTTGNTISPPGCSSHFATT